MSKNIICIFKNLDKKFIYIVSIWKKLSREVIVTKVPVKLDYYCIYDAVSHYISLSIACLMLILLTYKKFYFYSIMNRFIRMHKKSIFWTKGSNFNV